ncbi:protocatechuate 3,4-dioxygenase subunit alpha [Brevundimonas sp. S30B]|uniref:protocatechuate 3,4-dioxygenase subunit alpha n=1 Tax=unclassified Brevundimonas TaxID=2622653 RepID=UPI001072DD9B|nr:MULTISPECIES: protocatechuate 3,4-dioxygenase subunit alpha [unclassified Brevundimonas]QBX36659.1 protocatechuate 3,4-dioxygenase subunit alpha [Brevundimonas sp. MF30-B]TFW04546.1 protocatechuate 3,4-dioxygenase subunit alpha [Brevundimonas sp. S30B]
MDRIGQTPWQTVGPFFHYALPWRGGADLVGTGSDLGARPDLIPAGHDRLARHSRAAPVTGDALEIVGVVTDLDGAPVGDALIEIWQADAAGVYASPDDPRFIAGGAFSGFGRAATDEDGGYRFRTLRPGGVPGPDGRPQAPHLAVGVFGRGLLKRLVTRIYFAHDPANAEDAILALVPEGRRRTLLARPEGQTWRFDIRLSGPDETVFFDL